MKTTLRSIVVLALSTVLNAGQVQQSGEASGTAQVRKLVHDPKIVENGPALSPVPPGAPYSEWTINGSSYVVAYRNADKDDPNDIVADVYLKDAQDSRLQKLISVPVFSQVDDVKLVRITGDSRYQLAFFRSSGQQDWLAIVALHGPSARVLFDYGARWIKITEDMPPKILAHSHPDNTTEAFVWCKAKQKIVLENACGRKN